MSIAINDNWERDLYIAAAAQTVFTYSFPIYDETYLSVYQRGFNETPNNTTQLLTLGVDYTVTGVGAEAGGTIVLTTGADANDIIAIVGSEPIDRTSVFDDLNSFTVTMNSQLNQLTIMVKQVETILDHITPKYRYDELVSDEVRPLKRELPMLNNGDIWIGRGDYGDNPDDIITAQIGSFDTLGLLDAGYILNTPNVLLPNSQDLSALGEGVMYITPTAGVGVVSLLNFGPGLDLDTATDTLSLTGSNVVSVNQAGHGLLPTKMIRLDQTSGLFEYAIATTDEYAEVLGMVIEVIDADNFTYQEVGRVPDGLFSGLTPGGVYYLSATMLGGMTLTAPSTAGHINLPVFIAVSATTGDIRQSRGYYVGSVTPTPPEPPVDPVGTVEFEPKTDTYVTTTSGWEPVFCASITPSASDSRIYITANVAAGAAGSGQPVYFRLTRDGTEIGVGDAAGSRLQCTGGVGHHFDGNPTNWFTDFIDSPATTDTVVYCVEIISPGGAAAYVNRTTTDTDSGLFGRSSSSINLIEVGAP